MLSIAAKADKEIISITDKTPAAPKYCFVKTCHYLQWKFHVVFKPYWQIVAYNQIVKNNNKTTTVVHTGLLEINWAIIYPKLTETYPFHCNILCNQFVN